MLVLSRKKDEIVNIYTDQGVISILVVDLKCNKVRLGISAPKEISILRGEINLQNLKKHKHLLHLDPPTDAVAITSAQKSA